MKTLSTFDFAAVSNTGRKSPRYEMLSDGQIYVLERGVDFTAKYLAAQIRKYVQAKQKCDWSETHKFVRIAGGGVADETCTVQFAVNGEFVTPKAPAAKVTRSAAKAAKRAAKK